MKISTDVSENGTPNVNYSWNGRMVGKQKSSTQALRTVTIGKSWVQRLDTAIANINAVSLNFWLIKLVKEQSLIFFAIVNLLRVLFWKNIKYSPTICCVSCCTDNIIIHQTHCEKSDWSRAFNQFTIACKLDMINAISAADIAFIMSSSTSAWLPSPLECSPQKQNGWMSSFAYCLKNVK